MRLCGISSRFQLLSPGIGQVTHALLTRPPLTYISLGFHISPFDLHVLSTPPAFILSQDQTLMFYLLSPVYHQVPFNTVSILPVLSGFRSAVSSASLRFLRAASLRPSFTVFGSRISSLWFFDSLSVLSESSLLNLLCGLLRFWNFQGCIAVYLSRFISQTASSALLSTQRQLWYSIIGVLLCQLLFLENFPPQKSTFAVEFHDSTSFQCLSTDFTTFLLFFVFHEQNIPITYVRYKTNQQHPSGRCWNYLAEWAEKEGFEPSRRLPDLHP